MLRKIYGLLYNTDLQVWERRTIEQLTLLYGKESIVQFLKNTRMEWADHVWRADYNVIKTVLVNNILNKKNTTIWSPKQK